MGNQTHYLKLLSENRGPLYSITDPENMRKRLLTQDNLGLVPAYAPLHRANQQFTAADDVFDVMTFHFAIVYLNMGRQILHLC